MCILGAFLSKASASSPLGDWIQECQLAKCYQIQLVSLIWATLPHLYSKLPYSKCNAWSLIPRSNSQSNRAELSRYWSLAAGLNGCGRSSLSDPSPQPCIRKGSSYQSDVRFVCTPIQTSIFGLVLAFVQLVASSILPLLAPLVQAVSQSSMLSAPGRRWRAFSQPYHVPESLLPSLPPLTAGSPSSGLEVMACPSELSPCPLPELNLT